MEEKELLKLLKSLDPNFDPEGPGYDYQSAIKAGMGPGKDRHWGSVAEINPDLHLMLKGHGHPTWNMGMEAELARGSEIKNMGGRYFSVPKGK